MYCENRCWNTRNIVSCQLFDKISLCYHWMLWCFCEEFIIWIYSSNCSKPLHSEIFYDKLYAKCLMECLQAKIRNIVSLGQNFVMGTLQWYLSWWSCHLVGKFRVFVACIYYMSVSAVRGWFQQSAWQCSVALARWSHFKNPLKDPPPRSDLIFLICLGLLIEVFVFVCKDLSLSFNAGDGMGFTVEHM